MFMCFSSRFLAHTFIILVAWSCMLLNIQESDEVSLIKRMLLITNIAGKLIQDSQLHTHKIYICNEFRRYSTNGIEV